jgi:integrase
MRAAINSGLAAAPFAWAAWLVLYDQAMRAAGRSPGTIRLHRHYLARLRDLYPDPCAVQTADLQAFLSAEHWAPETRKSARSSVRSFYRWAHGAGHIPDDPSARLDSVRVPAGRPRPAPEHVVRQLLAHPDPRIGLMGMLAAFGGLRAAEIAQVHARDLVGDELIVHGKGGKVRAVPVLDGRLFARLQLLDGWAFPNGHGDHITPGHASRLLSRALPDGWTAHTLRHRCASVAYAATRDLLAVGALLGHSRPETTQRYVAMPNDAIRAAAAAAVMVA